MSAETEAISKLLRELSQAPKTPRELALERALRRQAESHQSIGVVLRGPATEAGIRGCIAQCDQFTTEAHVLLRESR